MTPEEEKRIVNDAMSKLRVVKEAEKPLSDTDKLLLQARGITDDVRRVMAPIVATTSGTSFAKQYDPQAMKQMVATLYIERFDKLTKDECVFLLALVHAELFMETV